MSHSIPFRACHTVFHSSSKSLLKVGGAAFRICESSFEVDQLSLQLNVTNLRPNQVPTQFNKNSLIFCCQEEWVKWIGIHRVDQQLELIQSKFSISKSPIIGNSTLQSLDFIDCEVFSIVYDHLERGPRYAGQLNTENSTRFPLWFRTEFLFKILFSVCCLRTPVWPVAPVPGDVPINEFPLLWQHGCEYQPCVRVALCLPYVKWLPPCSYMEYCYHGHIWVRFEATFIAESRFRAVTLNMQHS